MLRSFDPFYREHTFYEYKIKISKKEKEQISLLLKNDKLKQYNFYSPNDKFHHISTFESGNSVLDIPLLKNIKKQISDILTLQGLKIEMSWAQSYNKGNRHMIHTHERSILSGIIYINGTSPTVFYGKYFDPYYHNFNKNTLLLFPSQTPHEVHVLNEDEDRVIISFNTEERDD